MTLGIGLGGGGPGEGMGRALGCHKAPFLDLSTASPDVFTS